MINKFKYIAGLIFLLMWAISFYMFYGWELYGYKLIETENDDVYFEKRGQHASPSGVLDYDWQFGYLIGFGLQVDFLKCKNENGYWLTKQFGDRVFYFVLDVTNESLFQYYSRLELEEKLASIGKNVANLNYAKIKEAIAFHSERNKQEAYSNCEKLHHKTE
jgi:hypothetical protein